jgi:hypothetical protein
MDAMDSDPLHSEAQAVFNKSGIVGMPRERPQGNCKNPARRNVGRYPLFDLSD